MITTIVEKSDGKSDVWWMMTTYYYDWMPSLRDGEYADEWN